MAKSITDLSSVMTIGLDLAKQIFQVHMRSLQMRVMRLDSLPPESAIPDAASKPAPSSVPACGAIFPKSATMTGSGASIGHACAS